VLIKNQPQYLVVAETLIRDIGQNKYSLGDLLPPEIELADRFGVSRNTMRAAMRVLVDMGLVSRRAGMGTVVQARAAKPNYVQAIESPSQLFAGLDNAEQTVESTSDVVTDKALGMVLACSTGETWVRFEVVQKGRKGQPALSCGFVYVPTGYRSIGKQLNKSRKPAFLVLERAFDMRISEVIQQADAFLADERVANLMNVPQDSAVLRTVRRFVGEDGKIAMVTDTYTPSGTEHFTMRFRTSWPKAEGRE
jgi:GntR family transcriptional regulator